jgi:hypothetical protein
MEVLDAAEAIEARRPTQGARVPRASGTPRIAPVQGRTARSATITVFGWVAAVVLVVGVYWAVLFHFFDVPRVMAEWLAAYIDIFVLQRLQWPTKLRQRMLAWDISRGLN